MIYTANSSFPKRCWHEVVIEGAGQLGADEVESATWIKTQAATNRQLVNALQQDLDAGEAEAIALTDEAAVSIEEGYVVDGTGMD